MTWLVTGGAGYIGAHVTRAMTAAGMNVVVLDDLSTGEPGRVTDAEFVVGSVLDSALVTQVLRDFDATGVVHIAGKKQVGESVADPLTYYRENVQGLISLIDGCRAADVDKVVFSSSAAVYGMVEAEFVDEDDAGAPLSPYGETKWACEQLLRDCAGAYGMRTLALRYFNVAGAATPQLGDPAVLNLIQLVFQALASGARPRVFGDDYPTADGTCVRDFVHVADIAEAHLVAAQALADGAPAATYNIGRGAGYSVREVIAAIADVTGLDTTYDIVGRRAGDPARVVADVRRARTELGFEAAHDLPAMVSSAWTAWQQRHGDQGTFP